MRIRLAWNMHSRPHGACTSAVQDDKISVMGTFPLPAGANRAVAHESSGCLLPCSALQP